MPIWKPPNYNEFNVSDKPAYVRSLPLLGINRGISYRHGWPLTRICESMLSVDDEFGRLRHALSTEGRLSNTLFVLTGDNGMAFGAHRWRGKIVPYATQLPLFVSWGAGSRHALSGRNATPLENVDWAPTLCELAGCSMGPYPNGQAHADGRSFLGLIDPRGSSSVPVRRGLYLEHREGPIPVWRGLITTRTNPLGSWLYVAYGDGEKELYRLSSTPCWKWKPGDPGDPCMLHNLAGKPALRAIQKRLAAQLRRMVVNVSPGVP